MAHHKYTYLINYLRKDLFEKIASQLFLGVHEFLELYEFLHTDGVNFNGVAVKKNCNTAFKFE